MRNFPDYLSYSSISMLLDCAEQWRRKYLMREPMPKTPALVFGSAFHETIESQILDKALHRELGRHVGDKEESIIEAWNRCWVTVLEREGQESIEWGVETPEQHFNEGVRIFSDPEVQELARELRPLRHPDGFAVELKCQLHVPGVPIPIVGYIDIITEDGVPGDFKTSSKRWSSTKAEDEIQPLFYLAALNQMGFNPPLRFRHYVVTKTKQVAVQRIETKHELSKMFWLFELIQRAWELIQSEVYPFGPSSWRCSPKYCPYWATCRGRKIE